MGADDPSVRRNPARSGPDAKATQERAKLGPEPELAQITKAATLGSQLIEFLDE